jgi:hypothetical protein
MPVARGDQPTQGELEPRSSFKAHPWDKQLERPGDYDHRRKLPSPLPPPSHKQTPLHLMTRVAPPLLCVSSPP